MSFSRFFQLLFFTLVVNWLNSQNVCDCDSEFLQKNNETLKYEDSTQIFNTIKKILNSKNDACLYEAKKIELSYFCMERDSEKALKSLRELEELTDSSTCPNRTYDLNYHKALYYKTISDFENLSKFAFKALKDAEKLQNIDKEIETIKLIVHLFTRMKQKSKKWDYVKRAEKLILNNNTATSNKVRNYTWLTYELENQYTIEERKSLIDSALNFINEVKNLAINEKMFREVAMLYRASEAFSYHKGDLSQALVNIDSAIYYAKKIKGRMNMSGFYLSKSWDHYDLGQHNQANLYMDSALYYDDKTDIVGHMMLLSEASEIYEGSGASKKALYSLKLHSKLKDSLMSEQRSKVVNELETKYQTELKDAQIRRLTIQLTLALLGLISILFIGALFRLKQSRKQNTALKLAFDRQIQLEKELSDVRDEIAQDFHDDLGNRLARISILSNLISGEASIKDTKVKSKIKQITEDANSIYRGTRDFVFSLKSNSDYIEEIATYLSDFGEDFFDKTNIKFTVAKNITENKKLPNYWSKQLIFIFKEALTNTLKHSQAKSVSLSFKYHENQLTANCKDDGKGMNNEDINSHNGLLNMERRANKIGGKLLIETDIDKGTTITFVGKIAEHEA